MPDHNDHNHNHHHRHHPHGGQFDWRNLEAAARRSFGRVPGMKGFADGEGFGDNFRIGRMLASGDLRLVALYLIEQQPRHGYDLIKAIEEKTAGFYTPSPGVIYPALTYLEEAGFVTAIPQGNKKAYEITDEGRAHLDANRAAVESTLDYLGKFAHKMGEMRERMANFGEPFRGGPGRPDRDIPDVLPEVNEARRALKDAIAGAIRSDEASQRRLAEILARAAREIGEIGGEDVDLG